MKWFASLVIREMHINHNEVSSHPLEQLKLKRSNNTKCSRGWGATRTHTFLVGMQNIAFTLENLVGF